MDERTAAQQEQAAGSSAANVAAQMAASEHEAAAQNPQFLQELRDAGLDADAEAELGSLTADAFAVAVQDKADWLQFVKWISRNEVERDMVQRQAGAHFRRRPRMLAIARGLHRRQALAEVDLPDGFQPPRTPDERQEHRRRGRAMRAYQSLGAANKGLETVGEVQVSTEVSRSTEEESTAKRLGKGVFR